MLWRRQSFFSRVSGTRAGLTQRTKSTRAPSHHTYLYTERGGEGHWFHSTMDRLLRPVAFTRQYTAGRVATEVGSIGSREPNVAELT